MPKTSDPLDYIPSVEAIRKRLAETSELHRKLTVLLELAEQLECEDCRENDSDPSGVDSEESLAS